MHGCAQNMTCARHTYRANLQRYVASVWTRSSLRAPELILAVDRRAPSQAPRGPPARPPPAATHSRRKRFAPQAYGHTDDEEEQDDMQARASVPTRRKRSAPSAYNDFETEDGSNDVDDQHQLHGRRPRSAAFTGQMQQGRAARKGPGASGDALNSFRSQSRPPSAPGAFSNSPPHGRAYPPEFQSLNLQPSNHDCTSFLLSACRLSARCCIRTIKSSTRRMHCPAKHLCNSAEVQLLCRA